jgi:hypothetical protein
MDPKRFLIAVSGVAVIAALTASNASATAVTVTGKLWHVASLAPLGEGKSTGIKCGPETGATLKLEGTVGSEAVKLSATGIKCSGATLFNEYIGGVGHAAKGEGKVTFTGVSLIEPSGCAAPTEITTNILKSETYMGGSGSKEEERKAYDEFEPAAGPAGTFATISITGSCAAAGNRIIKGFVLGKFEDATGVQSKKHVLEFSPTIDSETGDALTLAGNVAHLDGKVNLELTSTEEFWVE